MRPDLDVMARRVDELVEAGLDPYVALVDADRECRPVPTAQQSVQTSLDLRG